MPYMISPGFLPIPAIYRETKKNYEDNFKKWNGEFSRSYIVGLQFTEARDGNPFDMVTPDLPT